jgi:phenylacetate-coenzyme A ligase PaaK-like adenylate-forming protein
MLEPDVEARPWSEQLTLDDERFRSQLAYLLERSAFYQRKLSGADAAIGLADIAQLPLTTKDEVRATRTPENPFGAHLCAARDEIVRIYSTSGTTGSPSYIPLTAGDLENWVAASARSYAASGIVAGQRIVSTYFLTHLQHRAAPLLRFRTRDHVEMRTSPCRCGRTAPRVRCIGRTDDMLIVRGVNVFPSAVREVVGGFGPAVSSHILVKPGAPGVKQEPPLPVTIELAPSVNPDRALANAIRERLRSILLVDTRIELVPWGSLHRSEYKSKLVDW